MREREEESVRKITSNTNLYEICVSERVNESETHSQDVINTLVNFTYPHRLKGGNVYSQGTTSCSQYGKHRSR